MDVRRLEEQRFVDVPSGGGCRLVKSETERFKLHCHEYYEIFLALDDNITHFVNGQETVLPKGALVFIRPDDVHTYGSAGKRRFSFLNLTFTRETVSLFQDFVGEGFPFEDMLHALLPPTVLLDGRETEAFVRRMENLCMDLENPAKHKTGIRMFFYEIMTGWFSSYQEFRKSDVPLWLEQTCAAMGKDKNFVGGLPRMVELSGRTREHLGRSMQTNYGATTTEFINDLRLKYMAGLLKNSNLSATDICLESGFSNLSWAYQQFRKKYGVTPREFRRADTGGNH